MPPCDEIRELLDEYRRGELSAPDAQRVAAHLAECAGCRGRYEADSALAARLRGLPRTPAPVALRRQVRRTVRPSWVGRPWAAATLAAAVVTLALSPWVWFSRDSRGEILEQLLQSGVVEHRRILLQIAAGATGEIADPTALFDRVRALTEIQLPPVFAGAGELRLLTARPTVLIERKAAAAALRYPASPAVTYFLLPGRDLPMPAERRVQIEQYRPHMRQIDEFHLIYWKQGDLAYLMVSGLDDQRTRRLFLKMRQAL